MPAIIIHDDEELWGPLPAPPPGFVPPTIEENLKREFEEQVLFYLLGGRPIAVWPDWDYAEDWSAYPVREVHPFDPVLNGREITELEFRRLVKSMHGLADR